MCRFCAILMQFCAAFKTKPEKTPPKYWRECHFASFRVISTVNYRAHVKICMCVFFNWVTYVLGIRYMTKQRSIIYWGDQRTKFLVSMSNIVYVLFKVYTRLFSLTRYSKKKLCIILEVFKINFRNSVSLVQLLACHIKSVPVELLYKFSSWTFITKKYVFLYR